jgi:hypothetical protein
MISMRAIWSGQWRPPLPLDRAREVVQARVSDVL